MKRVLVSVGLALVGGAAMAASPMQGMKDHAAQPMVMGHEAHAMTAAAAAAPGTLTVSGCWVRSLPEPTPSAAYFVVHNSGSAVAKLVSAASDAYGSVMLHETTTDAGMSKMTMVHDIVVPAKGVLEFKPGGYHAMLEKARRPIVVGTSVPMVFSFDSGEKVRASCEVKPATTLSR